MADNFIDQLDEDITNVFLNPLEFADSVTITALDDTTATANATFVFEIGAVDNKERAKFFLADSVTIARGYYITFAGERWIAVDIRPDELGMNEVRCDKAEVTS